MQQEKIASEVAMGIRTAPAEGDKPAVTRKMFRYHSKPMSGMIAVYFSLQVGDVFNWTVHSGLRKAVQAKAYPGLELGVEKYDHRLDFVEYSAL